MGLETFVKQANVYVSKTTPRTSKGVRGVNNGAREQIETLFFQWGFTPKQISENMSMNVNTVYVHVHAIRKRLQAAFNAEH